MTIKGINYAALSYEISVKSKMSSFHFATKNLLAINGMSLKIGFLQWKIIRQFQKDMRFSRGFGNLVFSKKIPSFHKMFFWETFTDVYR